VINLSIHPAAATLTAIVEYMHVHTALTFQQHHIDGFGHVMPVLLSYPVSPSISQGLVVVRDVHHRLCTTADDRGRAPPTHVKEGMHRGHCQLEVMGARCSDTMCVYVRGAHTHTLDGGEEGKDIQ
jgi:hypothetical protein